jgi:outer membrane protein
MKGRPAARMKLEMAALAVASVSLLGPGPAHPEESTGSLTLLQAIDIAREKSPLLKAAQYQVTAADASVARARGGFFPRLGFEESFTRSDNPVFAFSSKLNQGRFTQSDFAINSLNSPDPITNFRTGLAVVQPLYTAGKTTIGLEQAKLTREATAEGLDRRRQEVIFQVARAYFGVLLADADGESVQAALRAAEANHQVAQDRFAAGLVVESDVLAAEVRMARLREQAILAESEKSLSRASLNEVMGRSLDEPVTVADRLALRPLRADERETLEARALDRRPDYRRIALEARVAERAIALAQAEFLPTVNGRASYELNQLDIAANGQGSWFVGLSLDWNIFNGLADRAKIAEARARLHELEAVRAGAASRIRLEVKDAVLSLKAATERIQVTERAVTQAEEALRISRNRYESGLTTIFDLLGSEAALTQARASLTRALYDQNLGIARLELAVGTIAKESF